MRRSTTLLMLVCLLLCACSQATPAVQPTPAPATATAAPPTATPTVTPTLPPTETPLPTATFTPSPTPVPAVIGAQNAARLTRVRQFGNGRLLTLAWSPDGKTLLALTTVKLIAFEPATAKPVWEVTLDDVQRTAAFTADGKQIVSLAPDGVIQLRDAADGALLSTIGESQLNLVHVALSPDGQHAIVSNTKRQTSIYATASGEEVHNNQGRGMQTQLEDVLLAPDGSWFVTSGYDNTGPNQRIQLWDTQSGEYLRSLQGIANDFLHNLAVSPDGKYLAGVSRLRLSSQPDISLIVWDSQTGSVVKKITRPMDITAFCFLADSSGVALALGTGQIEHIALPDGESKGFYRAHAGEILTVAAAPGGKWLASGDATGVVKVWQASNHSEAADADLEPSTKVSPNLLLGMNYLLYDLLPSGMSLAPDGAFAAIPSARRYSVDLMDLSTGEVLRSVGRTDGQLMSVALSADGKRLAGIALEDGLTLYFWDAESGRLIKKAPTDHNQLVDRIMFSPDGSLLGTLAGGGRGEMYLWDTQTGEKKMTGAGFSSMDFTRDGSTLVTDNIDFGLYFWDIAKGRQTGSVSADWVYAIDYAPDEKTIAIAGFEVHQKIEEHINLVTFLDTATKTMLPTQLLGDKSNILAVRYSPDGALIATLDEYGCLTLWDAASTEVLAQARGVSVAPFSLEFLPEGRGIVIGGGDGTLHVFEVR